MAEFSTFSIFLNAIQEGNLLLIQMDETQLLTAKAKKGTKHN